MRKVDEDFVTDADIRDGFVESDAARAERLSERMSKYATDEIIDNRRRNGNNNSPQPEPSFDFSRAVTDEQMQEARQMKLKQEKNGQIAFDMGQSSNDEKAVRNVKGVNYTDPTPEMSEKQISDMMLEQQERSEYRYVDAAMSREPESNAGIFKPSNPSADKKVSDDDIVKYGEVQGLLQSKYSGNDAEREYAVKHASEVMKNPEVAKAIAESNAVSERESVNKSKEDASKDVPN